MAEDPTPDRRTALLDAALSLFAQRGFYGTAVPQIAERAGVGVGTLYRHFGDKEGLVNALYQHLIGMMEAHYQAIDHGLPFRARFRALFFGFMEFSARCPELIQFMEMRDHGSYLNDESWSTKANFIEKASVFVEDGQREGVLKPIAPKLALAIIWGIQMELIRGRGGGWLTEDEIDLEAVERCCWEAVRA